MCVCEDNVFNLIGYFRFIYIYTHARKGSIRRAKSSFEFDHSISYCILGAVAGRTM